jgi:phosphatidylglycerol:prolipoprotein diacylglycerol transferase
MMVLGFLAAVLLMRRLMKTSRQNPEHISNLALYCLIAGIVGSRLFYIVHYFSQFKGDMWSFLAVWHGGLEYLGGVLLAIVIVLAYLFWQKLPVRAYMDVLSIGLMLGLAFGRIGCFLAGDCFGKPTDCPIAIRFPYNSDAYRSQVFPDKDRNRDKPYIELPAEYFGWPVNMGQTWKSAYEYDKHLAYLKPVDQLTKQQLNEANKGRYRMKAVHPTQLYSSANALILCGILVLFRKKIGTKKPGTTFSLMFVLYGIMRFLIEFIRDDNPFEYAWWAIYKGGTVSQNIAILMVIIGLILFTVFISIPPKSIAASGDESDNCQNHVQS